MSAVGQSVCLSARQNSTSFGAGGRQKDAATAAEVAELRTHHYKYDGVHPQQAILRVGAGEFRRRNINRLRSVSPALSVILHCCYSFRIPVTMETSIKLIEAPRTPALDWKEFFGE